jgi:hypothetical protein
LAKQSLNPRRRVQFGSRSGQDETEILRFA